MLESLGYTEAPERDGADLILFNTCSIRESADSRFIAHLGQAKRLKSEDPSRIVGVGGCWAQSVKDEVFERFPFVDVAFGPGQIGRLAEFLTTDSIGAQGFFEFEGFAGHLPMKRAREFQAWLQISQGCNCVCSYCIVPSTRGREESRPAPELLAEVERLAGDGVREITLLGQNVNAYGRDLRGDDRMTFAELLRGVDAVEGIERIRYTSPHPKDMREDVILAHAECDALCEHIHLPLQSGSSPILKRMRRTYTRERYLDRVALIREHVPDCALTTDIIVGFPGETDEDFERTLEVVDQVAYDGAFTFVFSPRRGHRGGDDGGPGAASGQAGAHEAPRGSRAGAGEGARAAVRRPHAGRARRGPQPHRPHPPAGPQPPQQGRELRGNRAAGRSGRGRDRQGHVADAPRARADPQPRRLSGPCTSSPSSGRPRPGRPASRSPSPSFCGSAGRTQSPSAATRSRSIGGWRS